MGLYAFPPLYEWFTGAYVQATGKKPDIGKSCIRFGPTANIPYDLLGELCGKVSVSEYIRAYEQAMEK